MLKLIVLESVCLLVGLVMGKPLLTQNRGISPAADSEFNLAGLTFLVIVAVVAAISVAVGVAIRAGAGGGEGEFSDDEFEDIALTTASVSNYNSISREGPNLGRNGKTTRGKDVSWIIVKEFDNAPQFFSSDLA